MKQRISLQKMYAMGQLPRMEFLTSIGRLSLKAERASNRIVVEENVPVNDDNLESDDSMRSVSLS